MISLLRRLVYLVWVLYDLVLCCLFLVLFAGCLFLSASVWFGCDYWFDWSVWWVFDSCLLLWCLWICVFVVIGYLYLVCWWYFVVCLLLLYWCERFCLCLMDFVDLFVYCCLLLFAYLDFGFLFCLDSVVSLIVLLVLMTF